MSENSSKIGKYQFVAEPFHVDFTGRLTMGVLGNHLLNCAGFTGDIIYKEHKEHSKRTEYIDRRHSLRC